MTKQSWCVCIHIFHLINYFLKVERTLEPILALVCSPAQGTVVEVTCNKCSLQCQTRTVPTASHVPMRTYPNCIEVNSSTSSSDLDKFCVSSMMKLSNTLSPPLWSISQNWLHCASQWQIAVQKQQKQVLTTELHREYSTMVKFQESNT